MTIRFITDPAEVARVVQAKKELRRKLADDAVRQQRRREGLDDYNMAIKVSLQDVNSFARLTRA